ncbi:MAG: nodulation protein NodZ [Parachlamydiaceae bacterium]
MKLLRIYAGFLIVCLFLQSSLYAKPPTPQYLYVNECYRVGMFAEYSFVVGLLHEYDMNPEKYTGFEVDFKKTGFYYDPQYGSNWWNYFCEPLCIGNRSGSVVREFKVKDYRVDFAHALVTIIKLSRERVFEIIQKYIKIRPSILDKVDAFVHANFTDSHMIAVHYRGTDKKKEVPRVPYEDIAANVNQYIIEHNWTDYKIFVASDEQPFVQYMETAFPGLVVTYEVDRSSDGVPLHEKKLLNQYCCGESALIDCLLLSRADVLIRTESNLSLWSTYFNPAIPEVLIHKARAVTKPSIGNPPRNKEKKKHKNK